MASRRGTEPTRVSPSRHKSLFDALLYSAGSLWTTGLGMVASLLVRILVAVDAFGALNLVSGVGSYFGAYNAIYRNAISREVPAAQSVERGADAEALARASYTLLTYSVTAQSLALLIIALVLDDPLLRLAFFTGALLNLADALSTTDRILMRATQHFRPLAAVEGATGILSPALLIACSWAFGTLGYFAGLVAAAAVRVVGYRSAARRVLRRFFTWRPSGQALRQVLVAGASISVLGLAGQVLLTADRWIIAARLGTVDLGYYSLGTAMVASLSLVPVSMAGSYFSTLIGLISRGELAQAGLGTRKAQSGVTIVLVLMFGVLAAVIQPLIMALLPAYAPAIPALQVIMLQGYFHGARAVPVQSHIAAGRINSALSVTLVGVALAVALNLFAVRHGLLGVAIANTLAFSVHALLMSWSADRWIPGQDLLGSTLVGAVLLLGVYLLLYTVGYAAVAIYLAVVAGGAAAYLTRVLALDWRSLPASARDYLRS